MPETWCLIAIVALWAALWVNDTALQVLTMIALGLWWATVRIQERQEKRT